MASAEALRADIVSCVERRQRSTSEDFETAAREMFAPRSEEPVTAEFASLVWGVDRVWRHRFDRVTGSVREQQRCGRYFTPSPEQLATLRAACTGIETLIRALEGER
jgi:hypothetical protein